MRQRFARQEIAGIHSECVVLHVTMRVDGSLGDLHRDDEKEKEERQIENLLVRQRETIREIRSIAVTGIKITQPVTR